MPNDDIIVKDEATGLMYIEALRTDLVFIHYYTRQPCKWTYPNL